MTSQGNSSDRIEVPDAPPIPGLSFRHFRGESDYPHTAEVFTRSWVADGKEVLMSAEDAARFFSNMKNFDPYRDLLMVEVGGKLVAYGRADWQDEDTTDASAAVRIYAFKCYLAPEVRGGGSEPEKEGAGGLERAMLLYYERHLGEIARSHDFAGTRFLQT